MYRSPANNLSMSALRSQTACDSLLVCASFILFIELFVSFMAFWLTSGTETKLCRFFYHKMSYIHASRFHVAGTRHSSVVLALLPVAAANSAACFGHHPHLTWIPSTGTSPATVFRPTSHRQQTSPRSGWPSFQRLR